MSIVMDEEGRAMSRLSGWKRAVPCAVAAAMAVMVAACSSGGSSSSAGGTATGSTDATGAMQHGVSAVVIGPVDANTLDPATAFNEWETGGEVLSAIYDSLFTIGPTGTIQPYLAENFTTTDGQRIPAGHHRRAGRVEQLANEFLGE